jgi:CheY-like chemotaxis protein
MSGDPLGNAPASFAAGGISLPKERKILVVDDDAAALRVMGDMIEHLGHVPILCAGAQEALGRLQAEPCEILLVDYRMPELTGIDLLTILQTESFHLPVIMMTGYAATEERVSLEKLGIVAVLRKPIAPAQLAGAVEACLTRATTA